MSLRKSSDGSYWAPKRGAPPECPEGYINSDENQWRCIKAAEECEHRVMENYVYAPCGCSRTRVHCSYMDRKLTLAICSRCDALGKDRLKEILG
jgi:hypothetical protein